MVTSNWATISTAIVDGYVRCIKSFKCEQSGRTYLILCSILFGYTEQLSQPKFNVFRGSTII
jgi:hypothetical protein